MTVQHVQTKREIMDVLAAGGLRPRKRFGQNFLIDGNLMRRLADAAELSPDDRVLEVGPGTGGLTDLLVDRVDDLVCVEADRDLAGIIEDRFADRRGVRLIVGDVLERKHRLRGDVREAIDAPTHPGGGVKLVANLPYQVATPLVMNLLLDHPAVRRLCFTVQREVGERITAPPGCKAYGPLSITTQALCRVQTIAKLSPEVFWPRPTVDSVMIRMDRRDDPPLSPDEVHHFVTLVRGVFDHRRKTMRSAMKSVVEDEARERICGAFDATRRPESFSVAEWLAIHRLARGEMMG